jgi:diguanylate cyclase (GGDEF)-like protein
MGTFSAVRALSPHSLLRLYLVVVVCAAALAIGAVLWSTSRVDARTKQASSLTNAATAASQVQAGLRDPLILMMVNSYGFVLSNDGLAGLPDEQRAQLAQVVASSFMDSGAQLPLPDVPIPMPESDAVELNRNIELNAAQVDEIVAGVDSIDLTAVVEKRDSLMASLDAYLEDNSAANFSALFRDIVGLGDEVDAAQDRLALGVSEAQIAVADATAQARQVTILSLVGLLATLAMATFFIGRLISRAFQFSESERNTLQQTTTRLQYRNDQLNALYAVFSEITDTLSMRYVVNATLRETLRVMNGSSTVLRLMQGGVLVVVGSLTDEGNEIPNLPPVPLGEGPSGRVARRGRSTRIDHGAMTLLRRSTLMDDLSPEVESGIIVPLIIGARVVGTLAVWSTQHSAFTEEDERVLEMMASQVATAVVAADNAENSERRALHDPLTGLPNRRQLDRDIAANFGGLDQDGHAAIAMVDVDNFKVVNDEYGHRVGDVSLQRVASILRAAMREGDMIYRYGGEEFVAIFKGATGQDALVAAERLRTAVESTPITGDQLETVSTVTISIGLALMPDHGTDVNQLIEKADQAMYRAKSAGRNCVHVWEEEARSEGDLTSVA